MKVGTAIGRVAALAFAPLLVIVLLAVSAGAALGLVCAGGTLGLELGQS